LLGHRMPTRQSRMQQTNSKTRDYQVEYFSFLHLY
jgi:hypothetical protein